MAVAAIGLLVATMAGCTTQGIALRTDDRLDIVTPGDRDKVQLPLEITWKSTVPLDRPAGPRGYAVFLDREPMRSGQTLRSVVDDTCKRTPGCPNVEYLAEQDIYITNGTSITLNRVPDNRSANRTGARATSTKPSSCWSTTAASGSASRRS